MKNTHRFACAALGLSLLAASPLFAARGAARGGAAAAPAGPTEFKFDFSSGPAKEGFAKVAPTAIYSPDTGFGFEPGAQVASGDNGNTSTSDKPFFFSVKVPEGNYNITVTLGDSSAATTTTLKAESGRLMLERWTLPAGQTASRTFTTNVRTPKLPPIPTNAPGGDFVREDQFDSGNSRDWDDKLNIEINSPHAALRSIEISAAPAAPTVFLASDSTVTDRDGGADVSWGAMLSRFLKPGVAVSNQAQSGETLKSFANALRLDKILSQMKKGDYLFIQFAHNDSKASWPQTYVEPATTYKAYLKVYIAEALRRGATPVLVTSMDRVNFSGPGGTTTNSHGGFPAAMREVAKEENVALIDLQLMSEKFYPAVGQANAKKISGDNTHTVIYGGYELAKCIVMGIKQNNLDLAKYIVDDFADFDPAHPDPIDSVDVPASPSNAGARGGRGATPAAGRGAASGVPAGDPGPGPL